LHGSQGKQKWELQQRHFVHQWPSQATSLTEDTFLFLSRILTHTISITQSDISGFLKICHKNGNGKFGMDSPVKINPISSTEKVTLLMANKTVHFPTKLRVNW